MRWKIKIIFTALPKIWRCGKGEGPGAWKFSSGPPDHFHTYFLYFQMCLTSKNLLILKRKYKVLVLFKHADLINIWVIFSYTFWLIQFVSHGDPWIAPKSLTTFENMAIVSYGNIQSHTHIRIGKICPTSRNKKRYHHSGDTA